MRVKVCRKAGCNNVIPYDQANPYCAKHAFLYKPNYADTTTSTSATKSLLHSISLRYGNTPHVMPKLMPTSLARAVARPMTSLAI